MPSIPYPAFEAYAYAGILQGVFVGGCVDRGDGSSFRAKAHAHTKEPNKGWICVRSAKRLYVQGTDRPSKLMWHELCHLISGTGHTEAWRRVMRQFGQPIQQHHQRIRT